MLTTRLLARAALAAALFALIATTPAWGWGRDGHMMINYLGAKYLPHDVPAFLRNPNALDVMNYLGPEPDRWRSKESEPELVAEQAPDHFINFEYAKLAEIPCDNVANTAPSTIPSNGQTSVQSPPACGPNGKMLPKRRYDFIRALAVAQEQHPELHLTPESVGMQPWEVEEIWEKLKVEFREYRELVAKNDDLAPVETAILYHAAWLGHYVGDGSQPMHTTIEYAGWVGPNPHGYSTSHSIHSEFESVYVTANVKRDDVDSIVAASQPGAIGDEWSQYLDYLNRTGTHIEKLYQIEKAGGFTGAGNAEGRSFTDQRLADGAIELRNLIYSAWLRSADPVPEYHASQHPAPKHHSAQ